jgi:YfiH family protein
MNAARHGESARHPSASVAGALRERLVRDGLDWIVPEWNAPAGVGALVSTRRGPPPHAASTPFDLARPGNDTDADARSAALARLRVFAGYLPAEPCWLTQVHGTAVATLDERASSTAPRADAAVTSTPGVVCAVRIADCLPVFFADRRGSAVGVAHAGWRGLAAGVLETTLDTLAATGIAVSEIVAWLGPSIGPAAFEVGADVRDAFIEHGADAATRFAPKATGKWLADLPGLARDRLAARGVAAIAGGTWCTHTEAGRFFSFRRDRSAARMVAAIWLADLGKTASLTVRR